MNIAPKLLIVTVLYKCSLPASATLVSLATQRLSPERACYLLYDNSPTSVHSELPSNWLYMPDPSNGGLSKAYNYALEEAKRQSCTWLLVLDQDSTLSPDFLICLLMAIDSVKTDDVVVVAPRVMMGDRQLSPLRPGLMRSRPVEARDATAQGWLLGVNSGIAIKVDFIDSIGGFSREFWLDYLDHWLFRKIYELGKQVFVSSSIIQHNLSIANLNEGMTLDRYQNILDAEMYFTNHYLEKSWQIALPLRFVARSLKHLIRTRDRAFSLMMLSAAAKQIKTIFAGTNSRR